MDSIASFKSSQTQHDVHFVNHSSIWSKTENKTRCDLGCGYLPLGISVIVWGFWVCCRSYDHMCHVTFVLPLFPISSLLLFSAHSSMVLLRVSRVLCSNSQISVLLLEFRLPLILWTSLHFVFLYLDYGISLHGSSLLISICLLPRLCLGRLLCNTQDIFLISTFYGVQAFLVGLHLV